MQNMQNITWYAKSRQKPNSLPTIRYSSKRKAFVFNRAFVGFMKERGFLYYAIGFDKDTQSIVVKMSKTEIDADTFRKLSPNRKSGFEINVPQLQTAFEILGLPGDKPFEMGTFYFLEGRHTRSVAMCVFKVTA